MIEFIYRGEPLTERDLNKHSLPSGRVVATRPKFVHGHDLELLRNYVYQEHGKRLMLDVVRALLDDGKRAGATIRRWASEVWRDGKAVYWRGADGEFTPADEAFYPAKGSDALSAARSMSNPDRGLHAVAIRTLRPVVVVLDLDPDFTLVVSPFGEQGIWRAATGTIWRAAVEIGTGRTLGRTRTEAIIEAGKLVGVEFDPVLEGGVDPDVWNRDLSYVKFVQFVDVYDVDHVDQQPLVEA